MRQGLAEKLQNIEKEVDTLALQYYIPLRQIGPSPTKACEKVLSAVSILQSFPI